MPTDAANHASPDGAGQPLVRVAGLNHWYGSGESRRQALFDVHLEARPGEIIIMTGPSGSGKTTFLTLAGALRSVQQGEVEVLGRPLHRLGARELVLVRRDIGFIFQFHNLFESLTALENVKMSMELHGYPARQLRERPAALLTELGLGQRVHHKPGQLSGGENQRVAIARALVNRPRLVLADEPTAALDRESGRVVVELMRRMTREEGATIILVTHDNRIMDVADRVVTMLDGHVSSESGTGELSTVSEILKQSERFQDLSPDARLLVAQQMVKEKYGPGEMLLRPGEVADKLFLVRRGVVKILVDGNGGPRAVAEVGTGALLGEESLASGTPVPAGVQAKDAVEVYTLARPEFLTLTAQGHLG